MSHRLGNECSIYKTEMACCYNLAADVCAVHSSAWEVSLKVTGAKQPVLERG